MIEPPPPLLPTRCSEMEMGTLTLPARIGSARPAAIASALVLLTLVAFSPTLANDFVNWDDGPNFSTNMRYRGLGRAQIAWAWTTFHLGAYQPLGWMLLSAEYCAWGLDPRGYHAVSLLLHAATVVALYALTLAVLRRLGLTCCRGPGRDVWAGIAVAWYAVHPLRVEPVAWVSCQSYLPSALFYVLAILAYLRACHERPTPRVGWLRVALLLHGVSLLFKAAAITLPVILLILDAYPLRRLGGGPGRWFGPSGRRVWREKIPFLGLGLLFAALAYAAKATTFHMPLMPNLDHLTRVSVASYAVFFYLFKTLLPRDIAAFDAVPGPLTWTNPLFLASLLAVGGLSVTTFRMRRRWPGLLAVWAATLVLLSLIPGLIPLGLQLVAHRYTYVAAMVWTLAAAAGLSRLASSCRWQVSSAALMVASLGAIVGLVVQTRASCRTWHDSEALWTHALGHGAGRSMVAYCNLAAVYEARGQSDRAIAVYRSALAQCFDPSDLTGHVSVHFNLGRRLEEQGKLDEAVAHFAEVARLAGTANAHYHWGRVLSAQGKCAEAIPRYITALRINPNHAQARRALITATRKQQSSRDQSNGP